MSQLITHFCQFVDEPTARAALADYSATDPDTGTWSWRQDIVDAGIPVQSPAGSGTLALGYFLNIALPALNTSLPGLTGAGYRDPATKAWVTVYGAKPAGEPQREFEA